jgi:hypothetical protein
MKNWEKAFHAEFPSCDDCNDLSFYAGAQWAIQYAATISRARQQDRDDNFNSPASIADEIEA